MKSYKVHSYTSDNDMMRDYARIHTREAGKHTNGVNMPVVAAVRADITRVLALSDKVKQHPRSVY